MMMNTKTHTAALHPRRTAEYPVLLSLAALEDIFSSCADFQTRTLRLGLESNHVVTVCWIDGLVSARMLTEDVIRPLTSLARLPQQETERQKTLKRELEWIHMSPKGRHDKSKARINAYENLLKQESEKRDKDLQIYIPAGPRLGDKVIVAENVTKSFGDRVLVENMSFNLPAGGIIGVIGPNGAGKTTLFKMITGQEKPDSGTITIGETVKLAYVEQTREKVDPKKSIYDVISGGNEIIKLGNREINARAYVARFNFSGADQQKLTGVLSGGERNRVQLAMMLKEGANVLLLDEPTNDLDVNTMRALEEGILNFAGCVIVISHDRWFLDRICTHILAFEGDSKTFWFEGNFTEYEENKKKRLGLDADQPHRIKYHSLTRD